MRRVFSLLIISVAAAAILAPEPARADGYVSPWAAVQFSSGSHVDNGRAGVGVTAGAMGAGILGAEVDFGYSPSFFGTRNDFGHNTVIDVMGNVIVGIPVGGTHGAGARPFVTGGVGLLRTQIDGGSLFGVSSSENQFGWNAGGGIMGFFSDHVGLRGDVRYLRVFSGHVVNGVDLGALNFTRLSISLVVRSTGASASRRSAP